MKFLKKKKLSKYLECGHTTTKNLAAKSSVLLASTVSRTVTSTLKRKLKIGQTVTLNHWGEVALYQLIKLFIFVIL
jgi:hypothetical protein